MHSLFLAASVAAMAAVSSASPVETAAVLPKLSLPTVSQSLPVVKTERLRKREDILAALDKPFLKYSAALPEHRLRARAEKRATDETGSVTTTPTSVDVEYLVPLTIQDQTFNLILDTGSSDMWVFSDLMSSSAQSGHTIFNTSAAKQVSGDTWSVSYGDGSAASGSVYRSKVTLGDVVVKGMAVEAASTASSGFIGQTSMDGLLGLSFPSLNTVSPTHVKGFFTRARASLESPLFAVTLKHSAVGSLDFGYIDSSKYSGSIAYATVQKDDGALVYWELALQDYSIDGVQASYASSFDAIVDTGTSLMYLPKTIVEDYYAQIDGASYNSNWGAYVFPCNATLYDVGIYVDGQEITVPAEYISWESIGSNSCLGGLQSSASLPFSILGSVFLKDVYAVFEHVKGSSPRVGFAQQA